MDFLHGVIANLFTTFHDDGSLDDAGQLRFVDALAATGCVDTYFVRSGMGQMYTFGFDEVKQIIQTVCQHVSGAMPVLAGTSGIWNGDRTRRPDPATYTRETIELSQYAEEQGAAGVVLTIPQGLTPAQGETPFDVTRRFLEAVNEAIGIPIVLYQPPGTDPAYHVTVQTLSILADIPHVSGIKISTSDAGYILDMCWATRDKDFCFIAGNETTFFPALCCGATAMIGQGACLYPAILQSVRTRFAQGDWEGAIDAQRSVNMLLEPGRCSNPVAFAKRYFAEKGYTMTTSSRPNVSPEGERWVHPPLEPEMYAAFKETLESELARYATA